MSAPKYSYNVMVVRFDEEGNQTELIDRDLTADQAIDLMIDINEKIPELEINGVPGYSPDMVIEDDVDSEEEESSDDDEESEDDEEPAEQTSRTDYDRDALKEEIREGIKKPKVLAEEYGVSIGVVYQLKSDMKKNGELDSKPRTVKVDPEKMRDASFEVEISVEPRAPEHDPNDDQRTKQLKALYRRLPDKEKTVVVAHKDGHDRSTIISMHPDIEISRIDDLISAYGDLDL